MRTNRLPLPLDWTLAWSAIVTLGYSCSTIVWGGMLGALFAVPPAVFMMVTALGTLIVKRVRGSVSMQAWLLLLVALAGSAALLLPLMMLEGGDSYLGLVGLWSLVVLPLAVLLAATAVVVRHLTSRRTRSESTATVQRD